MRTLHVITGLSTGGAEMMLYKLLSRFPQPSQQAVLSLVAGGPLQQRIAELGVSVTTLGAARGQLPTPRMLIALRAFAQRFSPDVIQGWMYHGNLAAHAAAKWRRRVPVLWNVRSTLATGSEERSTTSAVIRLGARLSRLPTRIIYPSETAAREHETIGFAAESRVLIGNGFDVDRLAPNPAARAGVRSDLGLDGDVVVLGHVARYHRMKDHATLLRAFAQALAVNHRLRLVMVGRDVVDTNATLRELRNSLQLGDRVIFLGERHDVPRLTTAFDLAISSSSWGEAFPNILGEAMSCGVPCIATDVGDSAQVVGDTGRIVPPRAPELLARAIGELAANGSMRARLGVAARERIVERYALPVIVGRYEALYSEVSTIRSAA